MNQFFLIWENSKILLLKSVQEGLVRPIKVDNKIEWDETLNLLEKWVLEKWKLYAKSNAFIHAKDKLGVSNVCQM
jgi:hypothetical protein